MKSIVSDMLRVLLFVGAAGLLAPALAANPGETGGPQREFTKTINRQFATTANGMTALYNKYGKVTVNTWNQNSVKIDISIIVQAADQRSADRTFDRIKINFTSTSGYIKAETFLEEVKGWPAGGLGTCQEFTINYQVHIPAGNQLDLKNKYGNSVVSGALNGKLLAEIRYGDLRTDALGGDADLYIGNGKVFIARARNVSGQLSYGDVTLPSARNVQFDTRFCTLRIDRANSVRLTSRYDHFVLGTLDDLRLQTKYATVNVANAKSTLLTAQYTNVKVVNLSEKIDADLLNGSFEVSELAKNFSEVNVVGANTDVLLAIERGATFRFDTEGTSTGIRYPAAQVMRQHKGGIGVRASASGFVGNANARGLVKVRLENGGVVLK